MRIAEYRSGTTESATGTFPGRHKGISPHFIICLFCGKRVRRKPSLRAKYCSLKCRDAGRRITLQCARCKREYITPACREGQQYCSIACRGEAKRGANHPNWNSASRTFLCVVCSKPGNGKPSRVASGAAKYCSNQCRAKGTGEVNKARFKLKRIRKACVVCGTISFVKPSHMDIEGTYCSKDCMAKGYSKINTFTSAYSRTKSGKRADIGIFVRSSWEANYARYLNWLVSLKQIKSWQYEEKTFEFPVKKGSKFYTPDFTVINNNASVEYHEVKGWMDQKSKTKLRRMAKYFPAIKLVLIDEPVYKEIKTKVSKMVANWE